MDGPIKRKPTVYGFLFEEVLSSDAKYFLVSRVSEGLTFEKMSLHRVISSR